MPTAPGLTVMFGHSFGEPKNRLEAGKTAAPQNGLKFLERTCQRVRKHVRNGRKTAN